MRACINIDVYSVYICICFIHIIIYYATLFTHEINRFIHFLTNVFRRSLMIMLLQKTIMSAKQTGSYMSIVRCESLRTASWRASVQGFLSGYICRETGLVSQGWSIARTLGALSLRWVDTARRYIHWQGTHLRLPGHSYAYPCCVHACEHHERPIIDLGAFSGSFMRLLSCAWGGTAPTGETHLDIDHERVIKKTTRPDVSITEKRNGWYRNCLVYRSHCYD